jgi:hypothetical protein
MQMVVRRLFAMMLIYDSGKKDKPAQETPFMVLPRELGQLLQFLTREGYNPMVTGDRTISISKPVQRYWVLHERWNKFTGYDKILAALLRRYHD